MKLSENEIRDIIKHLEAGKPLPDEYRFLLFDDKRQVELIWNGTFPKHSGRRKLAISENPTDYLKKLRKRDPELGSYIGTNCPQIGMLKHILRIIQSIPSKKAEPFKRWLAQVGYERLQEIENPGEWEAGEGYQSSWLQNVNL